MSITENARPLRGPLRKRESHLWDRHPRDWYVEPAWVSERLFEIEAFRGEILDPACGGGNIVRSARKSGLMAQGLDIESRSEFCATEIDWLSDHGWRSPNIVSNPPFGLCDDRMSKTHPFVQRCLERADHKVALLMPANWVQGDQRSRWLERTPLYRVYFISPRPSMPPGPALAAGTRPGNGTTDYAWLVWLHGYEGRPELRWLRRESHA